MMEVTFNNLTVTIGGVEHPKQAYDRLCNALATVAEIEWQTDTYYTCLPQAEPTEERSTTELFPDA